MARPPLIKPGEIRLPLLLLLVFVLIAAAVNVALSVSLMRPRRIGMPGTAIRIAGAGIPKAWPSETPHDDPWPAPQGWTEVHAFGYHRYQVRSGNFGMDVSFYGWPLPVLEDKQTWWNWNDKALEGPVPDPQVRLLPFGVLLNPLITGVALWLLLAGPIVALVVVRRMWRRHGRQCVACGYPLGASKRCPECGARTETPSTAPAG